MQEEAGKPTRPPGEPTDPPEEPDPGEFDPERALSRLDNDRELLVEIAELFLKEAPRLLRQIREALDDGDAERVRRAAHTLKGTVTNFGAAATRQKAGELEKVAEGDDLEEAATLFPEIEARLGGLQAGIRDWIGRR